MADKVCGHVARPVPHPYLWTHVLVEPPLGRQARQRRQAHSARLPERGAGPRASGRLRCRTDVLPARPPGPTQRPPCPPEPGDRLQQGRPLGRRRPLLPPRARPPAAARRRPLRPGVPAAPPWRPTLRRAPYPALSGPTTAGRRSGALGETREGNARDPLPRAGPGARHLVGHVLAIVSQKGGGGKTTTAVNLAAAFARRGLKTVIVDVDPQGSVRYGAGLRRGHDTRGFFDYLNGTRRLREII